MKQFRYNLPIIIFCATWMNLYGQERIEFPTTIESHELVMPWNGGFNAPQFSNIDLNRDGITDMLTFDRQGDMLRTYIHLPASGRWVLDWNYTTYFPDLVDWVLVADFDKDGVEDLFTSSSQTGVAGIRVYKGSYSNDQWSFAPLMDRDKLYLQVISGGGLTNLYCSWDDIPSITDIDGDGDLDILAFEPGGSFISYFANQSIEMGWGTDSLRFMLKDICWGKILENELSEEVYLSDTPDMCSDGDYTGGEVILPRHAGSTVTALDVDFDGDQDAFVGDISSRRLVFLLNGLHAEDAWITEQDAHFPSQDTSVNLPYFIGTYFAQVDDDPEPELLAAVNSRSLTEDKVSVWRYDDDFNDGPLTYKLTEKGFWQNEMIDLGSHSRPAVADVNGDGLPDIVIGGYKYEESSLTRKPYLWLFENHGTPTFPYFELISEDFLSMSQFGDLPTFEFSPAFGDIDGNGSIDLIVGDQNGKLFFYKNIAAAGEATIFETAVYPFMNIAVGVSATPQIVDINGDDLGDLVVGERTGNSDNNGRCSNLNYYENIGSVGSAIFSPDVNVAPNTQCFGRVLFDTPIGLPQYSTPSVVKTQEEWILMTGNDHGKLLLYGDLQNGKTEAITLIDEEYGFLDMGNRSAPALADLNGDGLFDLIVGNQRGGVELFSTEFSVGITGINDPVSLRERPYHVNGNIGDGIIDVHWKNGYPGEIFVFDLLGREIGYDQIINGSVSRIIITGKVSGMYFLQIKIGKEVWVEKVVKG